jgi:hypothetical protein
VFGYAFGKEGGQTSIIDTGAEGANYKKICPPSIPRGDAIEKVCTTDVYNNFYKDRTWVQDGGTIAQIKDKYFGASGNTYCLSNAPQPKRGITGIWESLGIAPRRTMLEKSVEQIDNLLVPPTGPPSLGTMITNVFGFDNRVSSSINIPNGAHWFWPETDPDTGVPQTAVFRVEIPATLRDTSKISDTALCPSGPIVTTVEATKKLQTNPCDKLINGKPQAPGTFTESCLKGIFLSSGCKRDGAAYPSTPQTKSNLAGTNNDVATMARAVKDLYLQATTGTDSTGASISPAQQASAVTNCLGNYVADPCNTPLFATGPQTPECLDYLWRNKGVKNPKIGATYPPSEASRSSGLGTKEYPAYWCQLAGKMAPLTAGGKPNLPAIELANKQGSVTAIRDFYKQIHRDANYAIDLLILPECRFGASIQSLRTHDCSQDQKSTK